MNNAEHIETTDPQAAPPVARWRLLRKEGEPVPAPYNAMDSNGPSPDVSIVIPVYNEEKILEQSVTDLVLQMERFAFSYEVVLSENGSIDNTVAIGESLSARYPQVRLLRNERPDYGLALRNGIKSNSAAFILCDEIDICDVGFYEAALNLLFQENAQMVVGSKALKESNDQRPFFRRCATLFINFLLRVVLGFKGTDTHGLKAFHRTSLIETVDRCVVNQNLFASELVIRAQRHALQVVEIPVTIEEKRAPSVNLIQRVPHVLWNLTRLFWVIRVRGKKNE